MTRRLRIEWTPGNKITGMLAMPADPRPVGVLLAHGAGAGQEHPFVPACGSASPGPATRC